jgi:hypothetical protein
MELLPEHLHRHLKERIAVERAAGPDAVGNRQRVDEGREGHLRFRAARAHERAAAAERHDPARRASHELQELAPLDRSKSL